MNYSHRNGETDVPAVEGLYFVREGGEGGSIVRVAWQEEIPAEDGFEGYPARFEVWFIGSTLDATLDEFGNDAQWWGPVMTPWNANV